MKKVFLLILSVILPTVAWCAVGDTFTAQTTEGVTMNFQITSVKNKTCRAGVTNNVTDGEWSGRSAVLPSTTGAVTIPNKVNGYYVTEINRQAFALCSKITSITIPEGVTSIGEDAFYDCTMLSSITLPQTVKTIGNGAFFGCESLESISLPNGLESLGESAFCGCNSLLSITLPNNITTIENNTFDGCTALESATIMGVVRNIGLNAFQDCSSLDKLYIRIDDDFSIGNNAFLGCNELSHLRVNVSKATSFSTLLNGVDCSKITKIYMDALSIDSFESECIMLIGSVLTNVETVDFGSTINAIPAEAFLNHKHLKEVYLYSSNSSASIGDYAFDGCANLTYFQGGVYSLGDFCFRNTKITSLQLSAKKGEYWDDEDYDWYYGDCFYKELNHVGLNPFFGVDNFTFKKTYGNYELIYKNYNVNSSSIYDKSGKCCVATSSSSVSVSGTLADYAISGSSVKNLNLTNVTTVGDGFLVYCPLLEKITVNSDNTAFTTVEDVLYTKDMTELVKYPIAKNAVEMTIPASVTKIWDHAFQVSGYGTESLRIINVEATVPPAISYFTLDLYNSDITVRVPYGCKAAYEAVEGWRAFSRIVEMGDDITISSAGMGTFCSTHPLDFSGTDGIKAYIVSAFKPSTGEVTLTRITDVPANTGIVVKGDADTYSIPWGAGETVVANMLVGVTENTVLNKVNGDYTNYILAKKNGNLGFYAVSDGSTLSAGKAYLPLPTAQLPSGAGVRQMTMIFDDETTGIQQTISSAESNKDYYDLQGRRVSTPTHGLYIVNGKKVIVK